MKRALLNQYHDLGVTISMLNHATSADFAHVLDKSVRRAMILERDRLVADQASVLTELGGQYALYDDDR